MPANIDFNNDPFLTPSQVPPRQTAYRSGRATGKDKPVSPKEVVVIPLVLFIWSSLSFAFLWQIRVAPFALTLLGLLGVVCIGDQPVGALAKNQPRDATLGWGMCGFAVLSASLTGIYANEAYVTSFYAMALGREYHGVLASSPAAAYADAGKVHFAETSTVDTTRAVGYRDRRTYCAAPVVDSGNDQARLVGFWAIGLDCCNARGEFECGGGSGQKAGVRIAPDGFFRQARTDFRRAIDQAAAVHELACEDEPVLVEWVKDPSVRQTESFFAGLGIVALGAALFHVFSMIALALTVMSDACNSRLPK